MRAPFASHCGLPSTLGLLGLLGLLAGPQATLLAGCQPSLGVCDEATAFAVVSTEEGLPAYEGQALIVRSCGHGSFCHAEEIPAESRYGVPEELGLDLRLASTGPELNEEALARLDRHQRVAFSLRGSIWQQVRSGAMPPGAVGREVAESGPQFFRVPLGASTGEPLPELESVEGREILRNWLACGTPLIERTQPRADGLPNTVGDTVGRQCTSTADCVFRTSSLCDLGQNLCAPCAEDADCAHLAPYTLCDRSAGADECVRPIEARWSEIYDEVFVPRCATSACHGDRGAGRLSMRSREEAHASLAGVRADGSGVCRSTGLLRIAPSEPDASLLLMKLTGETPLGEEVCNSRMPLSGGRLPAQHIEAVRAWIAAGALAD